MLASRPRPKSPVRAVGLALALLAVALKVLLPPGFMPGRASNDLPFAIVLCTGYGPVELQPGQALSHREGEQPTPADAHDAPCAFAGQGTGGADALSLDSVATAFPGRQLARLAPAADLAPGRGLSAPPPPSTGPPIV